MSEHLRNRKLGIAEAVIERAMTVDADLDIAGHGNVEAHSVAAVSALRCLDDDMAIGEGAIEALQSIRLFDDEAMYILVGVALKAHPERSLRVGAFVHGSCPGADRCQNS